MEQFFLSFLATSLFMSIVIAAALAARALFPSVFNPNMRYAVWVVILLGLAIPIRPLLGDGVVQLPLVVPAESQAATTAANATDIGSTGNAGSAVTSTSATHYLPAQESLASAVDGTEASVLFNLQSLSVIEVLAIVCMSVALLVLIYHAWKHVHFLRLVRRWSNPVDDKEILTILQAVKLEKGINKKVALKKCEFISTSMIVGFFRPIILLPEKDLSTSELEMIFHHELVHYKRGDLFVKLLSVLATSLNWFNPAVYAMNRAMQADCEVSCDQSVIASIGSESKYLYAETVVKMAACKPADKAALSTCFSDSGNGLKTRVGAIVNSTGNIKKIAVVSLAVSSFVLGLVTGLAILAGSVFVFPGQDDSNAMYTADAVHAVNAVNDISNGDFHYAFPEEDYSDDWGDNWPYDHPYFGDNFPHTDPRTGERFIQGEGFWGDELLTIQLADGTHAPMSLHECLLTRMYEWIKITEMLDGSNPVNVSLDEARQIALEHLASHDIAVEDRANQALRLYNGQWVWVLWFRAQDPQDVPRPYWQHVSAQYVVSVDDGSIVRQKDERTGHLAEFLWTY